MPTREGRIDMGTIADTFFLLGGEVERLVNAPYAPSLQDLYRLTQQSPSTVVSSWVSQKPCRVGPLVDVLVDGLSRSRFALPLLTSFAQAQGFRDSLLHQYPYLLDQFLQQSIKDSEAKCHPVCLSLLSSPLPCGIVPPASLAPFVMQMIGKMRLNPCVETVRPLYLISSCLQASRVLFELPQGVMSCFQTELTKTLRNVEDHMGNLLCLGTFAKLASSQTGNTGADNGLDAPIWLQSIRHFFGPKRGLKTLDLVVLRVILACSSSCSNLTVEQSAESIRLAISICDGVDKAQREHWIEGNTIKLAKLCEKVTRDGIDRSVQILGVSFLASLIPAASLPPGLARLSLEWVLSDNASVVLETLPTQVIPGFVGVHAACLEQSALDKVLRYITSTLSTSGTGTTNLAKLQVSNLVLHGLRSLDLQLPGAVSEQYGSVICGLVERFPRQLSRLECDEGSVCYASALKLENDLLSDLLTFWFESTLPRSTQEPSCSSGTAVLIGFMKRNKLLLPELKCIFSRAKPLNLRIAASPLKTRETASIPRNDWRTGMRDLIMANSRMLDDSIMQKVEDVCYDLEQRCGSIEAPLRAAEEERSMYCLEAEQMKEQNRDLEYRLQQESSTSTGLREEMSRLSAHANSAADRVEELSGNITQVRHELEELRRTSQDTLSSVRESSRSKELDIIASLTERDERLDELQEEIKCQTEVNDDLRTKLASLFRDKDSSLEEISAMKDEVSILRIELRQNKSSLAQKDERINQLITEKDCAEKSTNDLQKKLHEEVSRAENLKAAFHDTADGYRVELEELRRQSELQGSRMAENAAAQKSEIISLQHAMHEARSDATRELQTKEKRIQHLEKKVQHLRDERAAKAREFSEAQQHISRLMGVMGIKPAPSNNQTSSKQRPRPSAEQPHAVTMQTQTDSGGAISQSGEEGVLVTSIEFTTPRPGGRSPKRARNSAFTSARPSPPGSHGSSKKSRESAPRGSTRTHQERKPLGEADHNNRPNPQSTEILQCSPRESFCDSQMNHQANQNHLDDIDLDLDLEFSKDFVFTSTSLSEMNGHART
ncbi:hypothetical protein BDW62DRAFT_173287 [Aspergillus aurantiobrunneus]